MVIDSPMILNIPVCRVVKMNAAMPNMKNKREYKLASFIAAVSLGFA